MRKNNLAGECFPKATDSLSVWARFSFVTGGGFARERRIPYHMPGLMDALRHFGVLVSLQIVVTVESKPKLQKKYKDIISRWVIRGKQTAGKGRSNKRWHLYSPQPSSMVWAENSQQFCLRNLERMCCQHADVKNVQIMLPAIGHLERGMENGAGECRSRRMENKAFAFWFMAGSLATISVCYLCQI